LDPVSWRNRRWTADIPAIMNGRRKCSLKNRDRVASDTAKPPQSHSTIDVPIYGIADSRLVITVAPQNDICPHGNTYPRKAVAIVVSMMITPMFHVSMNR
jgi:hypothetical protein